MALRRLWVQLKHLGVELNLEKTRMVNVLKGKSFGFLGFDLRRVLNRNKSSHFVLITTKKAACTKAKIRELIRHAGAKSVVLDGRDGVMNISMV